MDTFVTVLRNVTKEEPVQYVLAHLDNIVSGWSSIPVAFFAVSNQSAWLIQAMLIVDNTSLQTRHFGC